MSDASTTTRQNDKRNKVDFLLDVVNFGFDYGRRAFRKGLEATACAIRRRVKEDLRIGARPERKRTQKFGTLTNDEPSAPLRNRALSFFDDFDIICGVPVLTIEVPKGGDCSKQLSSATYLGDQHRSLQRKPTTVYLESYRHLNQRPSLADRGLSLTVNKISCHAFSHDDQLLVCGCRNGCLFVYDAERGQLLKTLENHHEFPVSDVVFRKDAPRTIVSVDLNGLCNCWDLNQIEETAKPLFCNPDIEGEDLLGMESAVPSLSPNGCYMALPMFMYAESDTLTGEQEIRTRPSRPRSQSQDASIVSGKLAIVPRVFVIVYVFEIKRIAASLESPPLYTLPITVSERWTGSECMLDLIQFSRTSKGLIFTVYELSKGFLVFWPNPRDQPHISYKLEGTKGRFSFNDRHLVTWRAILSSSEGVGDSRCFLWRVGHLESVEYRKHGNGWYHPKREAHNSTVLTDPFNGSVQECEFIGTQDDGCGLAVFCVTKAVYVVVWNLETEIPLHILETQLTRTDIFAGSYVNIVEETTRMERTCGVRCCAVSSDGRWIGIYSSIARKGCIWNAQYGVEVFKIENHQDDLGLHQYMDFFFSPKAGSLALVGKSKLMLWNAVFLQSYNRAEQPIYALSTSQGDTCGGKVSCQFSSCGNVVGLLPAYALSLDIWELNPQQHYQLNRLKVHHEFALNSNRRKLQRGGGIEAVKYRFCRFAIGPDIKRVVTCMGDMSVLLWNLKNVHVCRRIATLTSDYFPALDVCFSEDENGAEMVVICQDQGSLVWIDTSAERIAYRTPIKCLRTCKFSTDGKTAVFVLDLYRVEVMRLTDRTIQRALTYPVPLFSVNGFPPILSADGLKCLLGFGKDGQAVICTPGSKIKDLELVIGAPEQAVLAENGEWVLMYGNICSALNDVILDQPTVLDLGHSGSVEGYPKANYKATWIPCMTLHEKRHPNHNKDIDYLTKKGWKLVHLEGKGKSKQIRMHFQMLPETCIAISSNGRRCAALNSRYQLIVWGPEYTYNTIIQLREHFSCCVKNGLQDEENFEEIFNQHGPGFLNHPYQYGMTPIMECVQHKNKTILSRILTWSLENKVKLALQGHINVPQTNIYFTNTVDLALGTKVPDIAKMIANAMLDGITSLIGVCQIFEDALINMSSLYPAIGLDLWRHKNALIPISTVYVSEGFFKEQVHRMAVLTNKCNNASQAYVQAMWSGQESKSMKDLTSMCEIKVPAEAKMFPFPNAAKIGCEGIVQQLLFQGTDHQVFGSEPVKAIINYKYDTFGRSIILEDLYHYLLLLLLHSIFCILLGYHDSTIPEITRHFTIAHVVAIVGLGYLIRFLKQVNALWKARKFGGVLYYMCDVWKWIEFQSYLLVVVVIPITIHVRHPESQFLDGLMAVASVFLWVKLLYYAQAFKSTGPMIVMIKEIAKDIRWFLFLLVTILVGFGIAFFILMSGHKSSDSHKDDIDEDISWYFNRPWFSLLSMFILMLSDVSEMVETIIKDQRLEIGTRVLAIIFIVIFLAAVAIILLNLMIAIMGDSFDRVKNHEQTLFLKRRAEVIQDMEMGLSEARKKKYNKKIDPYLHVLTLQYRKELTNRDWEGRIVDVQRKMGEELQVIKEQSRRELEELRHEMVQIKRYFRYMAHSSSSSSHGPQLSPRESTDQN